MMKQPWFVLLQLLSLFVYWVKHTSEDLLVRLLNDMIVKLWGKILLWLMLLISKNMINMTFTFDFDWLAFFSLNNVWHFYSSTWFINIQKSLRNKEIPLSNINNIIWINLFDKVTQKSWKEPKPQILNIEIFEFLCKKSFQIVIY